MSDLPDVQRVATTVAPVVLEDGSTFTVRPIDKRVARDLIVANHYSRNWNTAFGSYCFGVFDRQGLAGAVVYGQPMNPASVGSVADLPPGAIVELNRLWIHDRLGPNTETATLARTFRWLKAESPVQLIQTFADGRLGVGTIYKASNFRYYGASRTLFFRNRITGQTEHGVPFTNAAIMSGMVERNARWARGELDAFEVETHRYLYPLTKYARRHILLEEQSYPTWRKGEHPRPDYCPPASQIARALLIAEARGWLSEAGDLRAYIDATYPHNVVTAALAVARENEWIAPLLAEQNAQPDLLGLLDGGAA